MSHFIILAGPKRVGKTTLAKGMDLKTIHFGKPPVIPTPHTWYTKPLLTLASSYNTIVCDRSWICNSILHENSTIIRDCQTELLSEGHTLSYVFFLTPFTVCAERFAMKDGILINRGEKYREHVFYTMGLSSLIVTNRLCGPVKLVKQVNYPLELFKELCRNPLPPPSPGDKISLQSNGT